ncbi:uncharacterized protein BO72DRAFT_453936 [Aspergillus fijiensis CBS 313.89]|uniref:Uncharacterized protein n=1 Tax=Aspergillus fijiensis CBS 313.89 TaxID=1448319 RepID=A0A8G1VSM3_9EURO|nr:uncharacterized protein BO72DRAFT_453936 [Aspergillus fijiensis CBS 313.89]RAK71177.1 hypothetical protein BO72DRAFT_453936 [Aspergillus fijiensis CBS 313.89]
MPPLPRLCFHALQLRLGPRNVNSVSLSPRIALHLFLVVLWIPLMATFHVQRMMIILHLERI